MSNPIPRSTKTQLALVALAALAALAWTIRSPLSGARPHAAAAPTPPKMPSGGMAMPQTLVCGLWRMSPDLVAKIHIKSALMVAPLAVTPTLYMADGTSYQLPPVEVPMSGEATVNINQALEDAPPWLGAHVSNYGSAVLTYIWDGAGHVSASMNMKDLVHSLTFHQSFLDQPSAMGAAMPTLTRSELQAEDRVRVLLANYRDSPVASPSAVGGEANSPPLQGLWWKRDPGVVGFFALANTSPEPIVLRYRMTGSAGAVGGGASANLGPYATTVVPLALLIATLPPGQREGGGIRVDQLSGPVMAVSASGWLENEQEGFSASIEFEPGYMPQPAPAPPPPPTSDSGPLVLAASGLMLGKPVSGEDFPAEVRFRPYGFLRNTTGHTLLVTVTASVTMGAVGTAASSPVSQSFKVLLPARALFPVALAPCPGASSGGLRIQWA